MIILRPDQQQLKGGILSGWNNGKRNMLAVLPTGGGKSVVVADIVNDSNALGAKQAVIAHRNELIGQMSLHVGARGVKHRIIGPQQMVSQIIASHRREFSGQCFINPSANCAVAGVDTLISRFDDLEDWGGQIDDWTIDEAHHVLAANKWGKAVTLFPNAKGLGVTASPSRADGQGLGRHVDGLFDDMVIGPSTRQLIDIGAISDYEYVCPASDFQIDDDAVTPSGDFSPKKMAEASKKSHIVGDIVKEYINRAFGRRHIVFATDVETAHDIAKQFQAFGIPSAAVSGKTPAATRDEYVRRFRDGVIWVLVNVDLFGEGFDVPACYGVSFGRPSASLAVFLQQGGRALRMLLGKQFGLIIDHVSNWKRHGLPDKGRFWTLDRRDKRKKRELDPEDIPLAVCRNCSRPYERFHRACPHCGVAPIVVPGGRGAIEQIDGDLILLDRAKLAEMRAATELESPASVHDRVLPAGGIAGARFHMNNQVERIQMQQRLTDVIAHWAGQQRAIGRPDDESYRRFYLTLGVDVLTAQTLPRADMEKLANTIQGWMR